MDFAIELLWIVAFVFATHRVSSVAKQFAPIPPGTIDKQDYEVPDDLVAITLQENEVWAQEEVMRVVRERYEELGDWNKVRVAVGVGRID